MYQFMCSCDTNLSYIGTSMQHLRIKAGKHFNLNNSHKNAIKNHLQSCHQCCNGVCNVTSFQILRKWHIDYDTKIHKALLIKKTKATTK